MQAIYEVAIPQFPFGLCTILVSNDDKSIQNIFLTYTAKLLKLQLRLGTFVTCQWDKSEIDKPTHNSTIYI